MASVAGPEIERLIQLLARLPGLGPRSARRAALHLIKKRDALMTPLAGALLMVVAGIGWGAYSLRGRRAASPLAATAGNFLRTVPMALLASAWFAHSARLDPAGIGYAIASGALASGLGYAIWYAVLPSLTGATAATVQLCVPVIAAAGGVAFLGEPPTLRLVVASIAIIGGIALVTARRDART